jgi:hypothetical protein
VNYHVQLISLFYLLVNETGNGAVDKLLSFPLKNPEELIESKVDLFIFTCGSE